MSNKIFRLPIFLFFLLFAAVLSCSDSNEQREFEREAFSEPANITQTNNQGQVQETDPDDWRIAPAFQGFVRIDPPFPNPVDVSADVVLELTVTGVQAISGLEVIVVFDNTNFNTIFIEDESPLRTGLIAINIDADLLGQFNNVESKRGIHRVVISEFNTGRIISYGDIEVE